MLSKGVLGVLEGTQTAFWGRFDIRRVLEQSIIYYKNLFHDDQFGIQFEHSWKEVKWKRWKPRYAPINNSELALPALLLSSPNHHCSPPLHMADCNWRTNSLSLSKFSSESDLVNESLELPQYNIASYQNRRIFGKVSNSLSLSIFSGGKCYRFRRKFWC